MKKTAVSSFKVIVYVVKCAINKLIEHVTRLTNQSAELRNGLEMVPKVKQQEQSSPGAMQCKMAD